MAVVEVTRTNIFQKFLNSLGGMVFGVIIFFIAIVILYVNDGRENPMKVATNAIEVEASSNPADYKGKFVTVTGDLTVEKPIVEEEFVNFKNTSFIALERKVEVYAWVEKKTTSTRTQIGGTDETTTTYSYEKKWVSNAENSSNFKEPQFPPNKQKPIENTNFYAEKANVGNFVFTPKTIGLRGYEPVNLTTEMLSKNSVEPETKPETKPEEDVQTSLNVNENTSVATETPVPNSSTETQSKSAEYVVSSNFVSNSEQAGVTPNIGDYRISYSGIKDTGLVTLFGEVSNSEIRNYTDPNRNVAIDGFFQSSKSEALATMNNEFQTSRWIFRIGGIALIWLALNMVTAPLTIFLDVIPFLGKASRAIIGFILLPIAILIGGVVILLSLIINNLWALILSLGIILISVGFTVYYFMNKKKKV